jgi:hypothetical protein
MAQRFLMIGEEVIQSGYVPFQRSYQRRKLALVSLFAVYLLPKFLIFMRLAQLARKVSIKQSEIIEFLATQQITVQDSSNARIEDEHMKVVVGHFAPALLEEISAQSADEEKIESAEIPVEVAATTHHEPIASAEVVIENNNQPIEVIKVPKVELPGLKVIGKIELPEPKKKDTTTEGSTTEEKPHKKFGQPRERKQFDRRDNRNPISLQREREEREAERKRQEQLKTEKELKTKRYLNKVKQQPNKPIKLVKEEVEEVVTVEEPQPNTLWGKFIKWLRT